MVDSYTLAIPILYNIQKMYFSTTYSYDICFILRVWFSFVRDSMYYFTAYISAQHHIIFSTSLNVLVILFVERTQHPL